MYVRYGYSIELRVTNNCGQGDCMRQEVDGVISLEKLCFGICRMYRRRLNPMGSDVLISVLLR
jgi:hypothetical protein